MVVEMCDGVNNDVTLPHVAASILVTPPPADRRLTTSFPAQSYIIQAGDEAGSQLTMMGSVY